MLLFRAFGRESHAFSLCWVNAPLDEKTDLPIFGGRANLTQIQRSKFTLYLYVGKCNANLQIYIASKFIANSMICYKFALDLLNIPNFACLQYGGTLRVCLV